MSAGLAVIGLHPSRRVLADAPQDEEQTMKTPDPEEAASAAVSKGVVAANPAEIPAQAGIHAGGRKGA